MSGYDLVVMDSENGLSFMFSPEIETKYYHKLYFSGAYVYKDFDVQAHMQIK